LQIACGLVVLAILVVTITSPGANILAEIVVMGFFVLIILLLGPWWPSADKAERWKLDLPTDDPKVALPLFLAAVGAFSFFLAWDAHTQPNAHFRRLLGLVAQLFGADGVAIVFMVVGVICFARAWAAFDRKRGDRSA
jgi:hypothetical protein